MMWSPDQNLCTVGVSERTPEALRNPSGSHKASRGRSQLLQRICRLPKKSQGLRILKSHQHGSLFPVTVGMIANNVTDPSPAFFSFTGLQTFP